MQFPIRSWPKDDDPSFIGNCLSLSLFAPFPWTLFVTYHRPVRSAPLKRGTGVNLQVHFICGAMLNGNFHFHSHFFSFLFFCFQFQVCFNSYFHSPFFCFHFNFHFQVHFIRGARLGSWMEMSGTSTHRRGLASTSGELSRNLIRI